MRGHRPGMYRHGPKNSFDIAVEGKDDRILAGIKILGIRFMAAVKQS